MNYVKKMCILRQIKQGFSADGKTLSGLIKIEQYAKNLAVEVSVINFAPLSLGEYYCLLSDGKGKTEMLALRGKSLFNILSDLDISHGFCGIICYVKDDVIPIAYGINGNGQYDWKSILNATLPPVFPKNEKIYTAKMESGYAENALSDSKWSEPPDDLAQNIAQNTKNEPTMYATNENYDDERVATENYYLENKEHGQKLFQKVDGDAHTQSANQIERAKAGANSKENVDANDVRHAFETDSDGYYRAVKTEIDELLRSYPRDDTLKGAFSCSEWVRVKGSKQNPEYLVGVVYLNGRARYICYALAAQNKNEPPEEIKNVCSFVPLSPFDENKGFFVIFQSAATGECVKPQKA